jgi:chemotaxis methyl-accepting protein methylase
MTSVLADLLRQRAAFDGQLCTGSAFALTCEHIRQRLGEVSLESLADRLSRDEDALELLAAQVAVPETWLFRYPASFEVLRDVCRARGRAVRMASIGCATGQEPLCMAAAALSVFGAEGEVVVDALDRNPIALAAARALDWCSALPERGSVPQWASPWIIQQDRSVTVHDRTRAAVRFHRVARLDDLLAFLEGRSFDVIFCRNMLMYLETDARMRLVDAIVRSVPVGGIVFLGHAENDMLRTGWERSAVDDAFAWQRAVLPPLTRPASPTTVAPPQSTTGGAWARRPPVARSQTSKQSPTTKVEDPLLAGDSDSDGQLEKRVIELFRLAEERRAGGDSAEAERLLSEVVFLSPQHDLALLALADLHERSGRLAIAAQLRARAKRVALREGGSQ